MTNIPEKKQKFRKELLFVGEIGLEPTTFAMSTRCSNQLSYPPEGLHYTEVGGFWQYAFSIDLGDYQGDIVGQRLPVRMFFQALQNLLNDSLCRGVCILADDICQAVLT